jgi:hypothetical protein
MPPVPDDVIAEFERRLRETLPPVVPPIDAVYIGIDHSTWLQRPAVTAGIPHFVLDERGNEIGIVTLPHRSHFAGGTRDRVWIVERDEDDVPSLVRYRVAR